MSGEWCCRLVMFNFCCLCVLMCILAHSLVFLCFIPYDCCFKTAHSFPLINEPYAQLEQEHPYISLTCPRCYQAASTRWSASECSDEWEVMLLLLTISKRCLFSLFVAKRGVFFIRCTLSQNKNKNMWGRLMLLQFCPKHQRPTLKPLRSLRRDVRFCRIQARIDRIRLPIFTEK